MDTVSPQKRSAIMAKIKSFDTLPELRLRRVLRAQGFGYRLKLKLYGLVCPDIVLTKYKVAIFIHGCFWHRHRGCKYTGHPKSNNAYWDAKFQANEERDTRCVALLVAMGWRVAVIWECWSKRKLDISWLRGWIKESEELVVSWPEEADFEEERRGPYPSSEESAVKS